MKRHYQVCIANVFYQIKLDYNRSMSLKSQFDREDSTDFIVSNANFSIMIVKMLLTNWLFIIVKN